MIIRTGQVKFVPEKGDLKRNHQSLMEALDSIDSASLDIIITPECFLDGYVCTEPHITRQNIHEYAIDPASSEFCADVSAWCRRTSTRFILGCMRRDEEGVYNTCLAFNQAGEIVGRYDKVHCQTHDRKYTPGDSLPVFDSEFGKFGMMICADRRWPETVRTLVIKGARVIFNPTYSMHDARNLCMMQTRSYESEVFIVFTHPRQSLITDPRGGIVVDNDDDGDRITTAEIDVSLVDRVRSGESAHLKDRRPEVYEGLSGK